MKVNVVSASSLLRALSSSEAPRRVPDVPPPQARWPAPCWGLSQLPRPSSVLSSVPWAARAPGVEGQWVAGAGSFGLCRDNWLLVLTGSAEPLPRRRAGGFQSAREAQKPTWETGWNRNRDPSYMTTLQTRDSRACTDTHMAHNPTRDPWSHMCPVAPHVTCSSTFELWYHM